MLILLDIDGVMVPAKSWRKPDLMEDGFPAFSPGSIKALQHILSATKASLLLTSSHKSVYSKSQWRGIFQLRGITIENLNKLDTNSLVLSRKSELLLWYEKQDSPINQFVIIDDDKSLNELPAYLKSKLILTSASIGLTADLAEEAVAMLLKKNTDLT